MNNQTYYDMLGVSQTADSEIIHAAYQALTKKYAALPSNDAAYMTSLIRQAYEVLSDPAKRADYDSWLRFNRLQTQQNHQPSYSTPSHQMTYPSSTKTHKKTGSSVVRWLIGLCVILAAVAVLAYYLVSSTGFFGGHEAPVRPITTAQQNTPTTLQPLQPIIAKPVVTPAQQAARDQAHAKYLAAVNQINAVWNGLPNPLKESLRHEQRSINKQREADCQAQAASQFTTPIEIETARYLCEVPQLNARTDTLQIYAAEISYVDEPVYVDDVSNDPVYHMSTNDARQLYHESVANLNGVWNGLSSETREALRTEQRAINAEREARCTQHAKANYDGRSEQTVARYLCEVSEMDARAEELSAYY